MDSLQRRPRAARLHFIPRTIRPLQHAVIRVFRRYFEQAPGWVLLTTTGRKTGLPREVLLPCERWQGRLLLVSTYGWESDGIRNLRREPRVTVTCAGWVLPGRAEVVEDLAAKHALVRAHPFFVPLPFGGLNWLHRTLLRPLTIPWLRWWVTARPLVVIHSLPAGDGAANAPV